MHDLRSAFRQLFKTPGFTAVVVITLALGIGANTAVLCWLEQIVVRPLPGVANQAELAVFVSNSGGGGGALPDYRDIEKVRDVFAGVAASQISVASLEIERRPEWIKAQVVTADFFTVLGVKPVLGRTFLPDEDQKLGGNPVLVISERLWRQQFNADPAVIGRVVQLNRHAFTIVGVTPAAFRGSMGGLAYDVWAPLSMVWEVRNQRDLSTRNQCPLHNVVRLRPGVTLAQAQSAVDGVVAELARQFPESNRERHYRVVPYSECPWGAQSLLGPVLRLLLAVSLGVLLIVAVNIASLLLARAISRRKEVAIRLAAGASPTQIARQFLIESILLALIGGAFGVLLATWFIDAIPLFLPASIRQGALVGFEINGAILGLTLLLTLGTGIGFGLVPAWQATKIDLYSALKEGGRSSTGGAAQHRLRSTLVVAEIALASVLLVGAGLCLKGFHAAQKIDPGIDADRVLAAELRVGMNGYTEETAKPFYRQLREKLATMPGVEEAALASWFPLGLEGCKGIGVRVDGYVRPDGEDTSYEYALISPRYFAVMSIPLLAGRDFTDADDASTPVAIVNEHFAQRFWPGRQAVGRKFRSFGKEWTVAGVAKAGKYNRLDEAPRCFVYFPYQAGVRDLDLGVCVRTAGDPLGAAETVRLAIHALDPGVEPTRLLLLGEFTRNVLIPQRMASGLLLLLGTVALLLAAMGVYAVMAYAVSQRTQEFGVRIALGARPLDVLWQVLRRGLWLALAGTSAGILLSFGVTRLLRGFLYGVSPFDVLIFSAVPLVLLGVAVLACYLPARRATRVDPLEALRAE